MELELCKSAFLDRFFPLEMRDEKVQDFINHHQESMSVREYTLMFTQFSKYALTLIANSRARMSKFLMIVFETVVKE